MHLFSGIGLGTFPFAGPFGPVSNSDAEAIIQTYIRQGGRYIDTSPTYAFGAIEELVGRAVHSFPRDQYFINTSCGYVLGPDNQFKVSGKYQDVIADCEASLLRLQVDYIDLYISHIPDPSTPFSETMAAMAELKERGKVKALGVSNVSLDQLKDYNATGLVSYVQNRFSFINHSLAPDFVAYCLDHNIGLVAYQVIERGLLTEQIVSRLPIAENDLRLKKAEFSANVQAVIGPWVSAHLKPLASELNIDVSSLCIWWALQQPGIAMCQMGAKSTTQVLANLGAATLNASPRVVERMNEAYKVLEQQVATASGQTVRGFLGLEQYDLYSGSASGKTN